MNATIIPFHVAPGLSESSPSFETMLGGDLSDPAVQPLNHANSFPEALPGTKPIASLQWRSRVQIAGRVKSIRVQPLASVPTLECVLVDGSGEAITLVFLGRRSIAGLQSGTMLRAEGMVAKHKGKLSIINPAYELLSASESVGT